MASGIALQEMQQIPSLPSPGSTSSHGLQNVPSHLSSISRSRLPLTLSFWHSFTANTADAKTPADFTSYALQTLLAYLRVSNSLLPSTLSFWHASGTAPHMLISTSKLK
jgi:hypothetical protein